MARVYDAPLAKRLLEAPLRPPERSLGTSRKGIRMNLSLLRRMVPGAVMAIGLTVGAGIAMAAPVTYDVVLDGPSESPPNASPGTGVGTVKIDAVAHTMEINVTFQGLVGNTTNCHIHAPTAAPLSGTAGVATTLPTFAGFPSGVTSGGYSNTLDMTLSSSYNPTYVTNNGGTTATAEAALFQAIADGKAYLNIHSTSFSGGEIRGFLVPAPVATEGTTWSRIKSLTE
jgi:hypothetical protein